MRLTATTTMLEAELLDSTVELAQLFGWRVAHFRPAMTKHGWRTPVAADGAGFPDLLAVRDRVLTVELKSAKGKLTPAQVTWLEWFAAAGVECHVWRPEQWADGSIESVLRRPS